MNEKFSIFLTWLQDRVNGTGAQYLAFGLFGLINYPGSYFFWHQVIVQEYNPLSLRLIAAAVCLPLIFHKQWPTSLQHFLPLYWYLTVLYCLPFFGTYMLLMNHLSTAWLMNIVLGLFLFILLMDWLMFILLMTSGIILAWLTFTLQGGEIHGFPLNNIQLAGYMYLFAVSIGIVFSRSKEKLAESKIQSAKLLAATIAHELRTPLAGIKAGAEGLQKYLPSLLQGYEYAQRANAENLPVIRNLQLTALKQALKTIEKEADASNLVITMLLTNLNANQIKMNSDLDPVSINACIEEMFLRYPLNPDMRSKVHWQRGEDFLFKGSELFTTHILFNLLKNALYYIRAANSGEIYISVDAQKRTLSFKDTGTGIDAAELPNIFKQFYSGSRHGTGVGLAFCKAVMKAYGGDITCRSEKGKYTEFTLSFPKIIIEKV